MKLASKKFLHYNYYKFLNLRIIIKTWITICLNILLGVKYSFNENYLKCFKVSKSDQYCVWVIELEFYCKLD